MTMEHAKHPFIPAIDPEHPDKEILKPFASICARKSAAYAREADGAGLSAEEALVLAAQVGAEERFLFGTFASTVAGVIARLMYAVPSIGHELWVDRAVADGKLRGLYKAREHLEHSAGQVVEAAYELINIEWDAAVDHYEAQSGAFSEALKLNALVETEQARIKEEGLEESAFLTDLAEFAEELEGRSSSAQAIRRLVQTLAPGPEELQEKLQIITAEQWDEDVAPAIARDMRFLFGRVSAPIETATAATRQAA
jgi:hypothetical protein